MTKKNIDNTLRDISGVIVGELFETGRRIGFLAGNRRFQNRRGVGRGFLVGLGASLFFAAAVIIGNAHSWGTSNFYLGPLSVFSLGVFITLIYTLIAYVKYEISKYYEEGVIDTSKEVERLIRDNPEIRRMLE